MFSNESMSPADLSAVMGNSSDGFGNGSIWVWLLIILFFIGGGNWNGNGNAATSTEVQNGFDMQNLMSRFDTIAQNQQNNAMDNANLINQNRYDNAMLINGINTNMLQTTANTVNAMNQGFDGVTMQINNLSHQIEQCGCNLKTQMLQDKYDAAQNQLNLAEIASANAVQTQNILSNLGKYYSNPPVNPYYAYQTYGTTIS